MGFSRWLEVGSHYSSLPSFPVLEPSVLQDFLQVFWAFLYIYGIIEVVRGWFPLPESFFIPSSRTKCSSGLSSGFLGVSIYL
jgi:hypothetical protein